MKSGTTMKFEYRIVKVPPSDPEAIAGHLNELGEEGWKVIWVVGRTVWLARKIDGKPAHDEE